MPAWRHATPSFLLLFFFFSSSFLFSCYRVHLGCVLLVHAALPPPVVLLGLGDDASPSGLGTAQSPSNTRQGLRVDTSPSGLALHIFRGLALHIRPSNTRQGLRVVTRWGYGLCLGQGFSLV